MISKPKSMSALGIDLDFDSEEEESIVSGKDEITTSERKETPKEEEKPASKEASVSSRESTSLHNKRRKKKDLLSKSSHELSSTSRKNSLSKSSHDKSTSGMSDRSRQRAKASMSKAKSMSHIIIEESDLDSDEGSDKKKKKEKDDKDKLKRKKKSRAKSDGAAVGDDASLSVASTMCSADQRSVGSSEPATPMTPRTKKRRDKEKGKKPRKYKSESDVPVAPVNLSDDEMDNIVKEIKAIKAPPKAKTSEETAEKIAESATPVESAAPVITTTTTTTPEDSSKPQESKTAVEIDFDKVWASDDEEEETAKKDDAEGLDKTSSHAAEVRSTLEAAVVDTTALAGASGEGDQREEVLRLQQQLSDALQKVVVMSEEQIQDKDQYLKKSTELSRAKAELTEAIQERTELVKQLKEREQIIEDERDRIDKLEQAIERQLDTQDALEVKLEKAEDEIEKLLIEIHELETKLDSGETIEGGGASFVELHEARKKLDEKEAEVESQKNQIEKLEKELKDSLTVPQLQIEELDAERTSLQGRLKADRLDYTLKLAAKDEQIAKLQEEVGMYSGSSDAQDLVSARQKLNEARGDANAVREELETANQAIHELQGERDDLATINNSLKETVTILEKSVKELTEKTEMLSGKVLEWTQKTYSWKSKAETAERKLEAYSDEKSDFGGSDASGDVVEEAPQGLFLQAAMDKNMKKGKQKWNIFRKDSDGQDLSADDIRIRTLEERNQTLEDTVAELRSEMVKLQTSHKEELYSVHKKIAQLQGENEALSLQNATLQELSRAHE